MTDNLSLPELAPATNMEIIRNQTNSIAGIRRNLRVDLIVDQEATVQRDHVDQTTEII
jgi:hypothetical protein